MTDGNDGAVDQLRSELDGLRRALRTRATIEQAMGVLVVLRRCSPDEAFEALVRLSQQYNTKLHRVAHLVVGMFAEPGAEPLEAYLRRKTGADETGPEADADADAMRADPGLLAAVRALVAAEDDAARSRAVHELYRLLLDRGWVPPYEVLGPIAGERR
ncbi:ANTAR domain-containing protein [Actinokineospora sp. PR83]|uniref:ANTAR domain-containing protein n=1 Tax=Actinokineospora sp. PR83 TaxID=2884908 RepID=UPI001F292272|nr:ANTAR domain-containing protein [Actinokineospora sp. PR83]MCG8914249.1 ANTAR domain-containing protein [Actinokineospora sp. PR83]